MRIKSPRNEAFPKRLRSLIAKEQITQSTLADHLGITRGGRSMHTFKVEVNQAFSI